MFERMKIKYLLYGLILLVTPWGAPFHFHLHNLVALEESFIPPAKGT